MGRRPICPASADALPRQIPCRGCALFQGCASASLRKPDHACIFMARHPLITPTTLKFRSAQPKDGAALWRLIQATGTLELNSAYFYLLFATDFGRTCLIAEQGDEVVGAVIGYHPPEQARTAFVWQVGLLPRLRAKAWALNSCSAGSTCLPTRTACGSRPPWPTTTPHRKPSSSGLRSTRSTECNVQTHFTADLFPVDHPPNPCTGSGHCHAQSRPPPVRNAATSSVGSPLATAD